VTRIEQRGAVPFTGAGIAAVVILLITLWQYLSRDGYFDAPAHQR
jgi:hypothetical protein